MSPVAACPQRSATRRSNACSALRPAASLAVTVTTAVPGPTAVTTSSGPAIDTAATAGSALRAANVIPSSSSSAKYRAASSVSSASSTPSTCGGIVPITRGARFTTPAASPVPDPVGLGPLSGPWIVTDGEFDKARPSVAHTAPTPSHAPRDSTRSVTGAADSGETVILHRSLRSFTGFTANILPPTTVTALLCQVGWSVLRSR